MLGSETRREGLAHKLAIAKGPQEVNMALMPSQELSPKGTVIDL